MAVVLALLGAVAAGAAVVVLAAVPGAARRARALAAQLGGRIRGAGPALARLRPGRVVCTPAVPPGTAGAAGTLAELGDAERATVLWQWADTVAAADGERRALEAAAAAGGLSVRRVGSGGAVAITGAGRALRAAGAAARSAATFTAAARSTALCVVE